MGVQLHRALAWEFGMDIQDMGPPSTFAWPDEHDGMLRDAAEVLYQKCLKAALGLRDEILADDGAVLAVERSLGDGPDEGTTDLVTSHGPVNDRYLAITDWKFTGHLKTEYVASRLEETDRTWQFRHYGWQAEQEYKLPVRYLRKALIVGGPKTQARLYSVEMQPGSLMLWGERDARPVWDLMERQVVWRNPKGCKPYGERYPCPFYQACWELDGDESRMLSWYERKERE